MNEKRTDSPPMKLCLRGRDCPTHRADSTWLHPAPRPRPAYAAAAGPRRAR